MSSRNRWINRLAKRAAVVMAAAAATASFSSSLWAASGTWTYTSGSNVWNSTNGWQFGNPGPNGIDQIATVNADIGSGPAGYANYTIALDANVTLGGMVFSDANTATPASWVLAPNGFTLTLASSTTVMPYITVTNMSTDVRAAVDIQVPIYGNQGLTVNGGANGQLLKLDAFNQFTGSITLNGGTTQITSLANLSYASSQTINLNGGNLSLLNGSDVNFGTRIFDVTGNSSFYFDNGWTTVGGPAGHVATMDTVMMDAGNRVFALIGDNGTTNSAYRTAINTLVLDTGNTASLVRQLQSNYLTIGDITSANLLTATTLTFGGTQVATTGGDIYVTGTISQGPSATINLVYTDVHNLDIATISGLTGFMTVNGSGSVIGGMGSVILHNGALPTGNLNVNAGTLDISATNATSTINNLVMGGGSSSTFGYINSGSTATLAVNGNLTTNAGTASYGNFIEGKLSLGSGNHTFVINQTSTANISPADLQIDADINAAGTLFKNNAGQMLVTGNNTIGDFVINSGTFAVAARTSGNAAPTGTTTISGGNFRLLSMSATPGSASLATLQFSGATAPARLAVDGSGTGVGAATLNIGTFLGRVPGTTNVLAVIPAAGSLNSQEVITFGTIATSVGTITNHTIMAPYVAAQANATDTSMNFLSTSTNHLVGATYVSDTLSTHTNPSANAIYSTTGNQVVSGSTAYVFAIKLDGNAANVTGSGGTLSVGDGTMAGIILNKGAQLSPQFLVLNAAEAVIWSGGRNMADATTVINSGGTINSTVRLASGNLTVAGVETLTFGTLGGSTGAVDLAGTTRTITSATGTTVFDGPVSNGSLVKGGPGYLSLANSNSAFTGNMLVNNGSLQIGYGTLTASASPAMGNATLATATIGNGSLVFNLDSSSLSGGINHIITNAINSTGTGALVVNSPTGSIAFTNLSNLLTVVQSGTMFLSANNQIPTSNATLSVTSVSSLTIPGIFDLAGKTQTISYLIGPSSNTVGTGYITNSITGLTTLTLNNTSAGTPNFSGVFKNGTGTLALEKRGSGVQILSGPTANFSGGTYVREGTLSFGSTNPVNGTVYFGSTMPGYINGALRIEPGVTVGLLPVLELGNGQGILSVAGGGSDGTFQGVIDTNGGTLGINWGSTGQTLALTTFTSGSNGGAVVFTNTGSGNGALIGGTGGNATTLDFSAATLYFGSSNTQVSAGGTSTVTFSLGAIQGGTNTIIGAGGAGGRTDTYNIGSLGGSSVFAGSITNGSGTTYVNKVGNGTLTLINRVSNYTGVTSINAGTFVIGQGAALSGGGPIVLNGGTFVIRGNGTITGANGITLSQFSNMDVTNVPGGFYNPPRVTITGTGGITGPWNQSGGTLTPGGLGNPGTVTFNNPKDPSYLTLSGGTVVLDMATPGIAGSGTNDLIVVNGTLNLGAATTYRFIYSGASALVPGQDYPVFQTAGVSSIYPAVATGAALPGNLTSAFHASLSLVNSGNGTVSAHVNSVDTGLAANLTWTGTTGPIWDLNSTQNFRNQLGNSTTFFQGDTVTFDNTGSIRPNLTMSDGVYLPAEIIFNNGSNIVSYTLGGSGRISGSGSIVRAGNGTTVMNLGNSNYTGGTIVKSGVLNVGNTGGNRVGNTVFNGPVGTGSLILGSTDPNAATLAVGSTAFNNDLYVAPGTTGNLLFWSSGGSVSFGGNLLGSGSLNNMGTLNITGISGNTNFNGNWDLATGTVIVTNSTSMNLRFGGLNAPGKNLYWDVSNRTINAQLFGVGLEMHIGQLAGQPGAVLSGFSAGITQESDLTWDIGGNNQNATFNGRFANNTTGSGYGVSGIVDVTNVVKEGTGTWTLTGVNQQNTGGSVTVRNGTMVLVNNQGTYSTNSTGHADGGGWLASARAVRVTGGTFALGGDNGNGVGIDQTNTNNGSIGIPGTPVLLTGSAGTHIDLRGAYDANGNPDPDNPGFYLSWGAYALKNNMTIAGNGHIHGVVNVAGNGTISPASTGLVGGGTISPGDDTGFGKIGTLTFDDGLYVDNGGVVQIDIGSVASAVDYIEAGSLQMSGGTLSINALGPTAAVGQVYYFIHSNNIAGFTPAAISLQVNSRGGTGTIVQGSGTLNTNKYGFKILTVGSSAALTWNGLSGTTWDAGTTTQKWKRNDGSPDYFYNGDTVTFNDAGGGGTINLATPLIPNSVTFNNNTATYNIVGTGKITGAAALHKSGTGTLIITTDNDYTGGTTIDAGGTLQLGYTMPYTTNNATVAFGTQLMNNGGLFSSNTHGLLGTGSIVNNGTLVVRKTGGSAIPTISGTGSLFMSDWGIVQLQGSNTYTGGTTIQLGAVQLGNDNALPTSGSINLNNDHNPWTASTASQANGGKIDLNGYSQTIEELNSYGPYGNAGFIVNNATLATNASTLTIRRTGPNGFDTAIRQGNEGVNSSLGTINLVKIDSAGVATMNYLGSGTWISNYVGRTIVNGGTLLIGGSHAIAGNSATGNGDSLGTYSVNAGGALGGGGTIAGRIEVNPGGILAPGYPGVYTTPASSPTASIFRSDYLTLNSANLDYELQQSITDKMVVAVDNRFLATGVSTVNIAAAGGTAVFNAGTYTLIDYGGAPMNNLLTNFTMGTVPAGVFGYTLVNNLANTSLDLVVTSPPVTATWAVNSDGLWSGTTNWSSTPINNVAPNSYTSVANFGTSISATRSVTMDGPYNLGTANFNQAQGFNVVGSGLTTMTFGTGTLVAPTGINVTAGSNSISAPLQFNNDGFLNVAASTTLSVQGPVSAYDPALGVGRNITKTGLGFANVDRVRTTYGSDGSAGLTVSQGTLQMNANSVANASEGSSKVNSLTIAAGAHLDITNNTLVIDYNTAAGVGSLMSTTQAMLADGRLFSSMSDATHTVGYKDNANTTGLDTKSKQNIAGLSTDPSSVLIQYTYAGDTNLDGQVDVNDLYNLASHWLATGQTWQTGDFNYDGVVNKSDLTLLARNWQAGVGNPLGSGLSGSLSSVLTSLGLPQVAVPEPSMIGLVGLGLTGLMARRRRRA